MTPVKQPAPMTMSPAEESRYRDKAAVSGPVWRNPLECVFAEVDAMRAELARVREALADMTRERDGLALYESKMYAAVKADLEKLRAEHASEMRRAFRCGASWGDTGASDDGIDAALREGRE